LIALYDLPLSRLQAMHYPDREALVNAQMSRISAIADFLIAIQLLTLDEIQGIMRAYQQQRPEIFT
jgi:hypothetical protein